jgi:hypothetical protein
MGALRLWPFAGQTASEMANRLGKVGEKWAGINRKSRSSSCR